MEACTFNAESRSLFITNPGSLDPAKSVQTPCATSLVALGAIITVHDLFKVEIQGQKFEGQKDNVMGGQISRRCFMDARYSRTSLSGTEKNRAKHPA
jgi:hypothetical protein